MKKNIFLYDATIQTVDGRKEKDGVHIIEKEQNGVTAVYIKAMGLTSNKVGLFGAFDPECAVETEITVNFDVESYMADYRRCEFWCMPYFNKSFCEMPDNTQALVIKERGGEYHVVLPVVNDIYKCDFVGKNENTFSAKIFSWCDKMYDCNGLAFVYASGKNPKALMHSCVTEALNILNNGTRHREQRRYPKMLEYLGWCTWDSMQIRVSEEGIMQKCDEFEKKDIPVKWAIIDDMWAEIHNFYGEEYSNMSEMIKLMYRSALYDFEADPIRFPNGLKSCVDKIHKRGIKVGMWHPTTGYWRGIEKDSRAYQKLEKYLIQSEQGYYIPDWHKDKSYLYYNTIHTFFRKCGVDFVKIDNQSMTRRFYRNLAPVGQVASEFHAGMEASVGEHFDNCLINCMGMASEDLWNRSVSPISRCSGDFQPENKEWFVQHILQCAYNSLVQGEFYWCDWDMWWTDDSQAEKNSLMRAISGGPIYVSDMIGRSNKDKLEKLCFADGKILRCDRPCIPCSDCVTEDPTTSGKAFKLQNMAGKHGIMAVLNLNRENLSVNGEISGEMIDGFEADEYAVYEHYSGEVRVLKKGESFEIELESQDEFKLYIFAPIKDGFAPIGRIDKFISPKSIKFVRGSEIILEEEGPFAYVQDGELVVVK